MTIQDIFTEAARQKMDEFDECGELEQNFGSFEELEHEVEAMTKEGWFS